MDTPQALRELAELSAGQWGLFTTGHAEAWGVGRLTLSRLVKRELIRRVGHGLYAMPSAPGGPFEEVRAAWLATDRTRPAEDRVLTGIDVVVSHASAAEVHDLGELLATQHEFTSEGRRQSRRDDVRFHRASLPREDITLVDGLAVTTVERTVADLAAAGVEWEHLAVAISDAVTRPGVRASALAGRLDRAARHYGHPDGDALLDDALLTAGVSQEARELATRILALESARPAGGRLTIRVEDAE